MSKSYEETSCEICGDVHVPQYMLDAVRFYDELLRRIKREQLNTENLPDEVCESWLALHQNAQVVWMLSQPQYCPNA
jgi:hypothetical protein